MADQNEIEFKLKTTGDTAGAEAVEKSIFKATDAAQEAQRQADVDAVKAKQAAEVQAQQADLLKAIAEGQQRIIAAGLAKELGNIAKGFGTIPPEAKMAIEATQNFLTVIASTGDPFKAIIALTATAVGGVVGAYRDAAAQAKQLAKDEVESIKKLKAAREEYATFLRTQGLVDFFKKELDTLEEQEKVLNRIVKINASERALAAQRQATAGAAAVAGGASQAGVDAQAAATANNNKLADLQVKLDDSKRAVEEANKAASLLELGAKALAAPGNDAAEAIKAAKAAEDARQKADGVKAEQTTSQILILNEMAGVIEETKRAVMSAGEAGTKAVTEAVTQQRDALQAEISRLGDKSSSGAREALAIFNQILANSTVDPNELRALAAAQERVRASQEAMNTQVREGYNATVKANDAILSIIQPVASRINQQAQEIADLKQQIQSLR